jgi:hypothetical protein
MTGATGVTGATGMTGATGATGATCAGLSSIGASGIYNYSFSGVLRNNEFVIKDGTAECDYDCGLEYFAFVKNTSEYIVSVFDDTHGKWVMVRIDEKISEVLENNLPYNVIEVIEWGEYTNTYMFESSNIALPGKVETGGTISYEGQTIQLDKGFPSTIKFDSLFVMEADRFDGQLISQMDNMQVNLLLAY